MFQNISISSSRNLKNMCNLPFPQKLIMVRKVVKKCFLSSKSSDTENVA